MSKFKQRVCALGAIALVATLVGCSGGAGGSSDADVAASEFPEGSKMAALAEAGTMKVGVQTTYPLIGMQTLNGFEGIDIEIAKLIGESLGIAEDGIEFVPVTTPTREPFLQEGKVDMILAAYTVSQEREDVVDFAGPYLESPFAFIVPKGNPEGIESLQDLKGLKLCTASGGLPEQKVRELAPDVAKDMVLFDSSAKCRDSVINGSVDAATTEQAILASFVAEDPDEIEVVTEDEPYATGFYGVGVRQVSDPEFCTWINGQLKDMFEDGRWAQAYNDTLGTVLGEAPEPPQLGTCGDIMSVIG